MFTLSPDDFTLFSNDSVIVRLPKELRGGNVNFTIENSGGDRYSTPVTKSFVLQPR
jgi:virulence-associated protein VagC